MEVIAIASTKGGVAKTITTLALAQYLCTKKKPNGENYSVLVVDFDPQTHIALSANLPDSVYDRHENFIPEATINAILYNNEDESITINDVIQHSPLGFDVLISTSETATHINLQDFGMEQVLRNILIDLDEFPDFVLIDTEGGEPKNPIVLNAICAADYVLLPAFPNSMNTGNFTNFYRQLRKIKQTYNPDLRGMGILVTNFDRRQKKQRHFNLKIHCMNTNLYHNVTPTIYNNRQVQVTEAADKKKSSKKNSALPINVFKTSIRTNSALQNCMIENNSNIFIKDKHANGAVDYAAFAEELLTLINNDYKLPVYKFSKMKLRDDLYHIYRISDESKKAKLPKTKIVLQNGKYKKINL